MPLLENLVEGFAGAAGDQNSVNRIEAGKADRAATQHEELSAKTQSILDDVHQLQTRRTTLDPKSPTYQKDVGEIDQSLHSARQAFTDLYHPTQNPGALQHLGGFLKAHALRRKSVPKTPGEAKQSFADIQSGIEKTAYAPQTPQAPPNQYLQRSNQLKEAFPNLSPDELQRIATGEKTGKPTYKLYKVTGPNGQPSYQYFDPAEAPEGAQAVAPGAQPKPKTAWTKKNGKLVSVQLDANNQIIPGSENPNLLPPAGLTGRVTTGFYHFVDDQGNVHQVAESHTSMPAGGGAGSAPSPAAPKGPGEFKQDAKANLQAPSKDNVLGHKMTAPQSKATTEYNDAVKLDTVASEVAQKPNDAINQKRLAVALEKVSAGRFTTQALDYIIKAGWGNTIEEWALKPGTGALPPDIMRQLIDGAHENLHGAKAAMDASGARGQAGGGSATKETKTYKGHTYAKQPDGSWALQQ